MRNNNRIITIFLVMLVVVSFLFAGFSTRPSNQKIVNPTCGDKQKIENCSSHIKKSEPIRLILDNLSQQFLSFPTLMY